MLLCADAVTVSTVEPLTDLTFAPIVVVPAARAVATPESSIVATVVSEDVQVVLLSGSVAVEPSLSVALATKVCMAPTAIVGLAGVGLTVLIVMPLPPPSKRSNGLPKQPANPIAGSSEIAKRNVKARLGRSTPESHVDIVPQRTASSLSYFELRTKWLASSIDGSKHRAREMRPAYRSRVIQREKFQQTRAEYLILRAARPAGRRE